MWTLQAEAGISSIIILCPRKPAMTSLSDIRSSFLDFYKRNGHEVVQSSPLVPRNDPTLMFTNSGMVQFKNLFTGVETRDYKRATSAQKCVRAGGKHNDLDNVGYTARHHTFFEMMGNFSFGDYFKEEAITLAWEMITKEFAINKDRLLVTVYHTDDEAFNLWKKIGVSEDRIVRIGTSDNFWQMGPTGPCGPCTEIFYDHGEHIWGGRPGSTEEDGDRFIEIWNVVFMQNRQYEDGSMTALDMQSIDTGMGLERVAALLQGSHDNYDTDLFRALIEASGHATSSDPFGEQNIHHRVIADHLRSTSFLIAEGVLPSNEGRGYVLRRIMRRAMRHAHLLGAKDPIMHRLVSSLVQQMGTAYPELGQGQSLIEETLLNEEVRFKQTLDRGLKLLDDEVSRLVDGVALPGPAAFKLYDTFGFPLDLTQDALRERGLEVDIDGFNISMAAQKDKARAAWSGTGASADASVWFEIADAVGVTDFLGYDTLIAEGQIVAIVQNSKSVNFATGEVSIILNQTPFYAESGGQVGDVGILRTNGALVNITDTKKVEGLFIHIGTVVEGSISKGQGAELQVDAICRANVQANHSVTHLLNQALRNTLGTHIAQRGSLNSSTRLRFDFSHGKTVEAAQLTAVQDEVNAIIRQNNAVQTRIMTPDDARAMGAQALFGEKYGDEVRVVSMGQMAGSGRGSEGMTYSLELCGGTHVARLGEIGAFVLLGDSASSSGVRRIEGLTGKAALDHMADQSQLLAEVAGVLKTPSSEVADRVKGLLDERKLLTNEIAQLRRDLAMSGSTKDENAVQIINGVPFLAQILQGLTGKDLPALIDKIKSQIGSGVVLLIADTGGKAAIATGVTADLIDKVSAVDLLRATVTALGGKGGGGRADMAQGGGVSTDGAYQAISDAKTYLEGL